MTAEAGVTLTNERSHHMLQLLKTRDKDEDVWQDFLGRFR
jgi:hypothetical protein